MSHLNFKVAEEIIHYLEKLILNVVIDDFILILEVLIKWL